MLQISKISYLPHQVNIKDINLSKTNICTCQDNYNFNLTDKINQNGQLDFEKITAKDASILLKNAHFPELENLTRADYDLIAQNMQTFGYDESIEIADNVLQELELLIKKSEAECDKSGHINVIGNAITAQFQKIGENILSYENFIQKLEPSNSNYVISNQIHGIAQRWHQDKAGLNDLVFCLTIAGDTTQFISPQQEHKYPNLQNNNVLNREVVDTNDIINAKKNRIHIFRGSYINSLSKSNKPNRNNKQDIPNKIFNNISSLIHRSPPVKRDVFRAIGLFRFKLSSYHHNIHFSRKYVKNILHNRLL
ncbi:MAG: hypothetical protein RLZZ210_951 [Pseudomonadota bacterium]|jgi:hypothetical protein